MDKSPVSNTISRIIDMILAGFWWVICSLPVITIGASSTALYYSIAKCVRHERGRLTACFFSTFKKEFKQSTLTWLIYIAYISIMAIDAMLVEQLGLGSGFFGILRWLFFLPALLTLPWMFAYISRFSNNIKNSFKFVGWLTMRHIWRSVLMAAELITAAVICWLTPMLLPLLPGALCLLMSLHIEPVFREYTEDQGDEHTDTWYNE